MRRCFWTSLRGVVLAGALGLVVLARAPAADADRIDAHTPLPSTALVLTKNGQASGFVVDREARLLLTNHHVAAKGEVQAIFPVIEEGQALVLREFYFTKAPRVRGTLLGSDPKLDLAAVRLESVPFSVPELRLAERAPQRGDRTHIVGNPANKIRAWVYDTGSVQSVLQQKLTYQTGQQTEARMLEVKADGLMAPGASGGPVVNNAGELIGVLCAGHNHGHDLFCVEVQEVRRFLIGIYRDQATQALRKREYREAIDYCDRALRIAADDALSYNERGAARSFLEQYDSAVADYTEALKLDPKLVRAWRNRGSVYCYLEKYQEAVADCTRAIELDPKYASAYQVRARAHRKLGNTGAASADEEKAAQLAEKKK
jgi:tetratricopeptide (TPR) repeat protein